MALPLPYDPPAGLADLAAIPGHLALWSEFVQDQMHRSVRALQENLIHEPGATPQFFGAASPPAGPVVAHDILWNAFPRELLRRFGRSQALVMADRLWPLPAYQMGWRYEPHRPLPDDDVLASMNVGYPREFFYRPQNEYCEWRVERNERGRLIRVTFTTEPPEYWQAMAGAPIAQTDVEFTGDIDKVAALYQHHVDPRVVPADLVAPRSVASRELLLVAGRYNVYNRWNTTDGIMHLCSPPNALAAEIRLAANATQRFRNRRGGIVDRPDVLMASSGLGGANRNSDTAIAAAVNALAREGRDISLANPIGICIDHVDTAGWAFPAGSDRAACVRPTRGGGRDIQRLVVQAPCGHDLEDITIGGVPIRYGGQIAECITVRLTGVATVATGHVNSPVALTTAGYVFPHGGSEVFVGSRRGAPPGTVQAYVDDTGTPPAADRNERRLPDFVHQGQVR